MTVPNKINGYEILSSIGSGAFGRPYRVKKGGQVYAMKVLKPEAIRDDVDRKRFQRESRALQKITSDHVVSYHDHGIFDDEGVETYYWDAPTQVDGRRWGRDVTIHWYVPPIRGYGLANSPARRTNQADLL